MLNSCLRRNYLCLHASRSKPVVFSSNECSSLAWAKTKSVSYLGSLYGQSTRRYTLKMSSYYSKYIPPTGVLNEEDNDEPWDSTHRPKRRAAQLGRRIEKLIRENDYYTMFTQEQEEPVSAPLVPIPEPRNNMDVARFLKTIGRGCEEHIDKFSCWEDLFRKSRQLREAGIPTRQRKWILLWAERYRQGFDPWYVPLKSKSKRNSYDRLEWRKNLVTQKNLRQEWGLD